MFFLVLDDLATRRKLEEICGRLGSGGTTRDALGDLMEVLGGEELDDSLKKTLVDTVVSNLASGNGSVRTANIAALDLLSKQSWISSFIKPVLDSVSSYLFDMNPDVRLRALQAVFLLLKQKVLRTEVLSDGLVGGVAVNVLNPDEDVKKTAAEVLGFLLGENPSKENMLEGRVLPEKVAVEACERFGKEKGTVLLKTLEGLSVLAGDNYQQALLFSKKDCEKLRASLKALSSNFLKQMDDFRGKGFAYDIYRLKAVTAIRDLVKWLLEALGEPVEKPAAATDQLDLGF